MGLKAEKPLRNGNKALSLSTVVKINTHIGLPYQVSCCWDKDVIFMRHAIFNTTPQSRKYKILSNLHGSRLQSSLY